MPAYRDYSRPRTYVYRRAETWPRWRRDSRQTGALEPAIATWSASTLVVTGGAKSVVLTPATASWSASTLNPVPPLSRFVHFPPSTHRPGRAALGGQLRSLGANRQGYPQEEVEQVMRSGVALWQPRFELYDVIGNRVQPDLQGVTAAKVTWDDTRDIKGSLELDLLADERLRSAFFRYTVKPYCGIGPMPSDGGIAEFPMGAYPWTKPKRVIEGIVKGQSEKWTITLGDKLHFLDTSGPGSEPFICTAGGLVAWYIIGALYQAGFTSTDDFSGLTPNDTPLPNDIWYTFITTARQAADGTWKNEGAEKWLNILKDLYKILGWHDPEFDNEGVILGRPDRAWYTEPPDVIYDTSDDGVILLPSSVEPDLKKIANRVQAYTENQPSATGFGLDTANFSAVVDLNDWLPAHPLAQLNSRHYIDLDPPLKGTWASEFETYGAALVELFKALAYYEKLTLKRVGFLAQHESSPIVGVRMDGDPELGGPVPLFQGLPEALPREFQNLYDFTMPTALYRETGRSLDLFTGEGESTLTRLARTQGF